MVALQTPRLTLAKIPFAYKRASAPFRSEITARFVNRHTRQIASLIGSGVFRRQRRLTGFRCARNLVRIRTNCPAARETIFIIAAT
jgi:hypothetical protein